MVLLLMGPQGFKNRSLKDNLYDETGVYSFFRNKDYSNNAGKVISNSIFGNYIWNQTQNTFDEKPNHFIQSVKLTKTY